MAKRLVSVALAGVLASSIVLGGTAAAKKVTITYWCPWSGIWGEMQKKLVAQFNASSDTVQVKLAPVDGGTLVQKFLTSSVAGVGPDVLVFWGFTPMSLAPKKVLMPLDAFIKADLKGNEFIPAAWRQYNWDGHTWGMAYGVSANCLMYNVQAFNSVGLGAPPRDLDEVALYSAKLRREEGGKLTRAGFLPWDEWQGYFNFSYLFGTDYFDSKTQRITAGSPAGVEALKWVVDFCNKQGGMSAVDSLTRKFGSDASDPFIKGQLGMRFYHSWFMSTLSKFAPKVQYGVAPLPVAGAPSPDKWALLGSDSIAIPAGTRHPKEAWEFVKWMVTVGQDKWGDIQGINSTWLNAKLKWPDAFVPGAYATYTDSVKRARPIPAIPVIDELMLAVNTYADSALRGKRSPEAALAMVDTEVQKVYDRWMKRKR